MEPSVARKSCSENSQAAVVPQQETEGSANSGWGIILKDADVFVKHYFAVVLEFKLKDSSLKNTFICCVLAV